MMRRDAILDNVRRQGHRLGTLLGELRDRFPWVADVRGLGLMWAVELTGRSASERAAEVQRAALSRGLIVECGGRGDAVLRLLPPLNITDEQVTTGAAILAAACADADPA